MKEVLGYHVNKYGIFCSDGTYKSSEPLLTFLMEPKPNTIRVFSNLEHDVVFLLQLIKANRTKIDILGRTHWLNDKYSDITMQYLPGKSFSIFKGWKNDGIHCGEYDDASQYDPELKVMSKDTGDGFQKARQAKEVAQEALNAYYKLGFDPRRMISPVNVFVKEKYKDINMPRYDDIPDGMLRAAYLCCNGGWFEAYKLGHFNKVWDWDISSAYPYQSAQLLDMRGGKFLCTPEYQADATYGYCKCNVNITSDFTPVTWKHEKRPEENYEVIGKFTTKMTKGMIDFIREYKLGEVEITNGWWWFKPEGAIGKPFERIVNELYNQKEVNTGMTKEILKRIMNGGFYGMMLQVQSKGDLGDYFFSPYAAEIENNTRIQVAKTCIDNNIVPIAIALDGFITDKDLNLKSNGLGSWKLNSCCKALVVSTHITTLENRIREDATEFSTDYTWLVNKIKENPSAKSYEMEKVAVRSLDWLVSNNKHNELGNACKVTRSIEIAENKRMYNKFPSCGGDLLNNIYDSKAWDADVLKQMIDLESSGIIK